MVKGWWLTWDASVRITAKASIFLVDPWATFVMLTYPIWEFCIVEPCRFVYSSDEQGPASDLGTMTIFSELLGLRLVKRLMEQTSRRRDRIIWNWWNGTIIIDLMKGVIWNVSDPECSEGRGRKRYACNKLGIWKLPSNTSVMKQNSWHEAKKHE